MGGWAYLLRCADNSYYAGSTSHDYVEGRAWEHNEGLFDGYTSRRRPVTLVWADWFEDLREAHATERRLKGWSRAKKEALIARDYPKLQLLAKRPSRRRHPEVRVSRAPKGACFEAPLRGAPQHDDIGVRQSEATRTQENAPDRHPEVRVSRAKLGTRASKET